MSAGPGPTPVVIDAADAGSSLLLDALETYGCAMVRDALPSAVLEAAARRANAHFFRATYLQTSAELAALDTVAAGALGGAQRPEGGTAEELLACLADSTPWRILDALYPHLTVALVQSRLRLARPSDDANAPFQQWAGSTRQRNLGFTFWLPLSGCGETAPSLELIARRSVRRAEVKAAVKAQGKEDAGTMFADLTSAQRSALWVPTMALGDLLVFDPLTLYRDAVRSDMRQARIAVECRVLRETAD
jgi:hypothetical protein